MNETKTTETKKKTVEVIEHGPVKTYDSGITTRITIPSTDGKRHVNLISWRVPTDDAECQSMYGITLSDLIALGVRGLSTRPQYPDDIEKAQALADAFKCGARGTGITRTKVKEKAAKLDSIEAQLSAKGMSLADLEVMIEKAKAAKK